MAFSLVSAKNGVKYLKSTIIPYKHGFSTRVGGVSGEEHTSSLNLAFGRGDSRETVLENLSLFSDALGIDKNSVISLGQIHSTKVIRADESHRGQGYFIDTEEKCDGYVTNTVGVSLGVKTADCVPILMCDDRAKVIGAVHAGWRGTAGGIAGECIKRMIDIGASNKNIRVAIGPSIHSCCYQVGEDFRDSVVTMMGKSAECFVKERQGSLYADIVGMNRFILGEWGIDDANIDVCEWCTCCRPEIFYSHRFSGGLRGTMLSVISM